MIEEFRPIEGTNGKYSVSNFGNVKNDKGKILSPGKTRGYPIVCLFYPTKRMSKHIHRLVMDAFVEKRPSGMQVNHIDGVKTNNRLDNLEYVTPSENTIHSVERGLKPCGDKHWERKKTHCPKGHPYNLENTFPSDIGKPSRVCRQCVLDRQRIKQSWKKNKHQIPLNHQERVTV